MTVPVPLTMPAAAGAQLLASAWADYYAGLWRGDAGVSEFAEWLAGFWEETLDRPEGEPAAVSTHAAGGRGIDWFESAGWVSGHIRGRSGGYLVPIAAILRQPWSLRVVPAA